MSQRPLHNNHFSRKKSSGYSLQENDTICVPLFHIFHKTDKNKNVSNITIKKANKKFWITSKMIRLNLAREYNCRIYLSLSARQRQSWPVLSSCQFVSIMSSVNKNPQESYLFTFRQPLTITRPKVKFHNNENNRAAWLAFAFLEISILTVISADYLIDVYQSTH